MQRSLLRVLCCTSFLLSLLLQRRARRIALTNSSPELVEGQEIPGIGGRLTWWEDAQTNAAGDILFRGGAQVGSGEAASSLAGLFLKRNGVIRPVLLSWRQPAGWRGDCVQHLSGYSDLRPWGRRIRRDCLAFSSTRSPSVQRERPPLAGARIDGRAGHIALERRPSGVSRDFRRI